MMYTAFCVNPLNSKQVEPDYEIEASYARDAGFEVVVVDHDELDHHIDTKAALKAARFTDNGRLVYRGWMLGSEAYAELHKHLVYCGIHPFVSSEHYTACHHAPSLIETLKPFTPQTKFLPLEKLESRAALDYILDTFGNGGVVIKDWVKSQAAGYWNEACYIPDASDRLNANKIMNRFMELQGDYLVGGIVFKAYVPLLPVGSPAYEYRAFVINKRIAGCWPRSTEAKEIESPPVELLEQIAGCIQSPFASIDLALDERGKWWLLEVGDGQVSGLPTEEAAPVLFDALANALSKM